ncbi:hypothetical protein AYO21_03998 [Fonsecaea monophora]|uniref:Uncharacterized protein n=1 Tax=Fonsecaea monophora TaxID=254056 RepID=A0A177FBU0_9EURO|nr:hypothetical protein AYO21_03998 [Fonsecaea monophora]OAG41763.1 hypothetical protein AYO21_03998 [Fonsecaea monophora]
MASIFSWFRGKGEKRKSQAGLGTTPSESPNLPHSAARLQDDSSARATCAFVGAPVDGQPPKQTSGVHKSMENPDLPIDSTFKREESLNVSAEPPKQTSLHNDDAVGEPGEQQGSATRIPPSNIGPDARPSTPDENDRSHILRSHWNQLNGVVESLTSRLITAHDLRGDSIRKSEAVLAKIESILTTEGDNLLPELRESLLGLKQVATEVKEQDLILIQQSYQIVQQGSVIFGPAAATSLQVLDNQGVVVRRRQSSTEESIPNDDIRLDETPEAQRYLSKKGDVDMLREILINMDVKRMMLFDANEEPEVIEDFEVEYKQVLDEMKEAQEELDKLYEELPERRVSISQEQFPEMDQDVTSQSYIDHAETGSASGSQPRPELPANTLSHLLESTAADNRDESTTLVKAYLDYQLQQLSREELNVSEPAADASQQGDKA